MSTSTSSSYQGRVHHVLIASIILAAACADAFSETVQAQDADKSRIILWRYHVDGLNSAADDFLASVNPADKKAVRLTKDPDEGLSTFPIALSPDGHLVAYTKTEVEGDNARFRVYIRPVTDSKAVGQSLKVNGYSPCWSPDGGQVVVVNDEDGLLEHCLVNVKTKEKKAIDLPKAEAPKDAKGRVGHLITDWSSDGQWFLTTCFLGDEREQKTQIYRVKRDGSEAHLVKGTESGRWGRFSPDGKRLLFAGPDKNGELRLFITDLAGVNSQRLSPELNGSIDEAGFCWSPDGKRVAYLWLNAEKPQLGQEYEMFLMVIDADGRNQVTVLSQKTAFAKPLRFPQWK